MNYRKLAINKRLDQLIDKGLFKNKFISIFGGSVGSYVLIEYLQEKNIKIDAIIDNNEKFKDVQLHGINVYLPEIFFHKYKENVIVLIASAYYEEMRKQLEGFGYCEGKHIFNVLEFYDESDLIPSYDDFIEYKNKCYRAYNEYKRILDKYGEDVHIMFIPYNAIGDIYFIGLYLNQYAKKNNIENFVVAVFGKVPYRFAKTFNFKNIELYTYDEIEEIRTLYILLGKSSNIHMLNHCIYTNIVGYFDGFKGYTWADTIKYTLMKLDKAVKLQLPNIVYREDYIVKLFKDNNLTKGNTIILVPFSKTLPSMPINVWEKLVLALKEKNYIVCTNCVGDEQPIKGTIPIFFPLEDVVSVFEYAGYFIGSRCGICDIVSSAKCKKIIIYVSNDMFWNKDFKVYFGIKNMGLCEDVIELEYNNSEQEIITNVMINVLA